MPSKQTHTVETIEEEEFSFRELFRKRKQDLLFLKRYRKRIAIVAAIGALFGAFLAWYLPASYTARISFVVEDTKSSGSGLVSALAGQFGFDIGGLTGSSSGLLAGDNVLELLVSRKMIKKTLTSPFDSSGYTLADRYADVYKLKPKWEKLKNRGGKPIAFPPQTETYSRFQDSLLHTMMKRIAEKEISVSKPDKKLSFFALTTTMRDEKLAELFSKRLMYETSEFYIQTKTKRIRTNVDRLQHRADSIEDLLNQKTYSASASTKVLLDLNPAYTTAGVGGEVEERDKRVLQTVYAEIVKNLEVSRTMLIQETPTFQLVDEPEMPLKKNKLKYPKGIVLGLVVAGFLYSLYLLLFKRHEEETN